MDEQRRAALVAQYEAGPTVLRAAVAGLAEAELDRRPSDGGWTPREVVHHVADSEMTSAIRLRLLVATPTPEIRAYDQDEFARRLHYSQRPIQAALDAFGAARRTSAEILDGLTEDEWQRFGTHTESGRYSIERWLEIYAQHAHEHARQILAARAAARAPLTSPRAQP